MQQTHARKHESFINSSPRKISHKIEKLVLYESRVVRWCETATTQLPCLKMWILHLIFFFKLLNLKVSANVGITDTSSPMYSDGHINKASLLGICLASRVKSYFLLSLLPSVPALIQGSPWAPRLPVTGVCMFWGSDSCHEATSSTRDSTSNKDGALVSPFSYTVPVRWLRNRREILFKPQQ